MTTYGGWTAAEIEAAEDNGDFIPDHVLIAYMNGDSDQNAEAEQEGL